MANKLKEFLFPSKEKEEFDSTTVVIKKNDIKKDNKQNSAYVSAQPIIYTPKVFSQVEEIANDLLNNISVIVDLTSCELSEAKRICDFLNGVSYSINGKVSKVAKLVYLFAPKE